MIKAEVSLPSEQPRHACLPAWMDGNLAPLTVRPGISAGFVTPQAIAASLDTNASQTKVGGLVRLLVVSLA